jgi:hypothetical protein
VPDQRPDPAIEVFGVDEQVWTAPGHIPVNPTATGAATSVGPGDPGESDEIRQGDQRQESARPGFGPRSSGAEPTRIPLFGGRTTTLNQLAAAVAALVVVAFVAGLVVGHGTRSGPHDSGTGPAPAQDTFTFVSGGPPISIFPTEPSFTIRVAAPNPLPSGTAGPKGEVAGPDVYALQLASDPATRPGQGLESRDAGAAPGPWSLIVRRSDGSLGRHSSVITFPVTPPAGVRTRTRVRVGASTGFDDGGGIVWPLDGKFARVRGDLGQTTLAEVAGRVSVRRGRPVMDHPPARFRVVATEPYRAPVVTELRYNSLDVNSGPIDGLIFTNVLRCGSFEEALYFEGFSSAGIIGGHPAVLSSVGGGNADLAWEPTPGSIVLVGFSGNLGAQASLPSLIELARGGRLLDRRQWRAIHPSVAKNTNSYA